MTDSAAKSSQAAPGDAGVPPSSGPITISATELAGGYFTKHILYAISAPGSTEDVRRRYSDFRWLRSWIVAQHPGLVVPPLPPKVNITTMPPGYLQERKADLERWLNRMNNDPLWHSSPALQMFLTRPDASFDAGRKSFDTLTKFPNPKQFHTNCSSVRKDVADELEAAERADPSFKIGEWEVPADEWRQMRIQDDFTRQSVELLQTLHASSKKLGGLLKLRAQAARQVAELAERVHTEEAESCLPDPVVDNAADRMKKLLPEQRVDVFGELSSWAEFVEEDFVLWDEYLEPAIRHSKEDSEALQEALEAREEYGKKLAGAAEKAARWKAAEAEGGLRSSQIDARHADIESEKWLKTMMRFMLLLCDKQLDEVLRSNRGLWKKAVLSFSGTQSDKSRECADLFNRIVVKCQRDGDSGH